MNRPLIPTDACRIPFRIRHECYIRRTEETMAYFRPGTGKPIKGWPGWKAHKEGWQGIKTVPDHSQIMTLESPWLIGGLGIEDSLVVLNEGLDLDMRNNHYSSMYIDVDWGCLIPSPWHPLNWYANIESLYRFLEPALFAINGHQANLKDRLPHVKPWHLWSRGSRSERSCVLDGSIMTMRYVRSPVDTVRHQMAIYMAVGMLSWLSYDNADSTLAMGCDPVIQAEQFISEIWGRPEHIPCEYDRDVSEGIDYLRELAQEARRPYKRLLAIKP